MLIVFFFRQSSIEYSVNSLSTLANLRLLHNLRSSSCLIFLVKMRQEWKLYCKTPALLRCSSRLSFWQKCDFKTILSGHRWRRYFFFACFAWINRYSALQ